jgi:DNA-directed RNA polymerase specialized sigma24 family protein
MAQRTTDEIYDQWLVLRAQDGDAPALGELVDRWHARLLRHARRLTDSHDGTGDVTQLAWVAIISDLHRLSDPACFRRWAYRIVGNKAADWVRGRRRDRVRTTSLSGEPADERTFWGRSVKVSGKERRKVLTDCCRQCGFLESYAPPEAQEAE